jgi:iron(III) transport system substrate-binding protein
MPDTGARHMGRWTTVARCVAGLAMLAAALAGLAGGASAQSDWDKLVAEAKKEGKLVIYNGAVFKIVREIGNLFQKEYGIEVEVLDGRASEIRERIRTEQAAGRAIGDLIIAAHPASPSRPRKAGSSRTAPWRWLGA